MDTLTKLDGEQHRELCRNLPGSSGRMHSPYLTCWRTQEHQDRPLGQYLEEQTQKWRLRWGEKSLLREENFTATGWLGVGLALWRILQALECDEETD